MQSLTTGLPRMWSLTTGQTKASSSPSKVSASRAGPSTTKHKQAAPAKVGAHPLERGTAPRSSKIKENLGQPRAWVPGEGQRWHRVTQPPGDTGGWAA